MEIDLLEQEERNVHVSIIWLIFAVTIFMFGERYPVQIAYRKQFK